MIDVIEDTDPMMSTSINSPILSPTNDVSLPLEISALSNGVELDQEMEEVLPGTQEIIRKPSANRGKIISNVKVVFLFYHQINNKPLDHEENG